jgi:hypothetical protein
LSGGSQRGFALLQQAHHRPVADGALEHYHIGWSEGRRLLHDALNDGMGRGRVERRPDLRLYVRRPARLFTFLIPQMVSHKRLLFTTVETLNDNPNELNDVR